MFSITILLLLVAFPCTVTAHASMIMPPSRNAIDATLPAWHNSNISNPPETGTIEPYNCRCTNGTEPFCNSGQGCFWFSQGCTIGCSKCDGLGARIPKWDHCPLESIKPTVVDPKYRSMNQNATAGSVQDIFYFNPWRAPGRAPVFDACGKAGGSDQEVFNAGAYNKTVYAQQGDLGSVVLKPRPTGTVWKRGSVEKARWQYTASHGGGYQFRLCPANEPLTEECFQKMPLKFAKPLGHTAMFANRSIRIASVLVPDSITGTGDWMLNPIPSRSSDYVGCDKVMPDGEHCPWNCTRCGAPWHAADKACPCKCAESYPEYFPSGFAYVGADPDIFPNPMPQVEQYHSYVIEDELVVPANIQPGEYVLGWRWDCEQTSQVWSSCSDITIE